MHKNIDLHLCKVTYTPAKHGRWQFPIQNVDTSSGDVYETNYKISNGKSILIFRHSAGLCIGFPQGEYGRGPLYTIWAANSSHAHGSLILT